MKDLTPEKNLVKTLELIDLCFTLKEAFLKQQYSQASPEKIRELIYQGIIIHTYSRPRWFVVVCCLW